MSKILLAVAAFALLHLPVLAKDKRPKADNKITTFTVHVTEMLDVFPLPGRLAGVHAANTVENGKPVRKVLGIVLEDADPAWRAEFAVEAPPPPQESDMAVALVKERFFVAASKAGLPIELKLVTKDGDLGVDVAVHILDAVRSGRTLRFGASEFSLSCFRSGQLDRPAFDLHYIFGDKAMARWDAANAKVVWSGFTVAAEKPAAP
jgi:hypothetical protein